MEAIVSFSGISSPTLNYVGHRLDGLLLVAEAGDEQELQGQRERAARHLESLRPTLRSTTPFKDPFLFEDSLAGY